MSAATRGCSVDDCERPHLARGRCSAHYKQWRKRNHSPSRLCSVEGCGRPHDAQGWCNMHHRRWLKHGDPLEGVRKYGRDACSVDDCDRPAKTGGQCAAHCARQRRATAPQCAVEGCDRRQHGRGLCGAHLSRWERHGTTEDPAPRVRRLCSVEGCGRPRSSVGGWCSTHALRWRKHGDPLIKGPHGGAPGARHPFWLGDDAGYSTLHSRVRKARGSATAHRCVECGGPAREWAYNHAGGERERTETVPTVDDGSVTLAYSLSVDDYDPMCLPCHRRRDGAKRSGPSRGRARGVVTYGVAHQRVRTRRGSASAHPCVDCGQPAAHWSYDNRGGEDERVNAQGQRYSVDVTAYDPMCRPCHRRRDDDARDERAS